MNETEFFKKHRDLLNISEFDRRSGIKGQLLLQVSRSVMYRHLKEDQEKALRDQLKPIYLTLKEIFE